MITFSNLGNMGRLGNQMFQYATLYSVALCRGYEIGIPKGTRLSEVFEIPSANFLEDIKVNKIVKEKSFLFEPMIFTVEDGLDFVGHFQSGSYFNLCRDSILKEFKFKKYHEEKADRFLSRLIGKKLCTIHVRRGDYVNLPKFHTNLSYDHYELAMKAVDQSVRDIHYLIFSDDIELCKKAFKQTNVTFVELNDDAVELCIMSKCPIHIISNSTFSWWGAWLSGSKIVIAPKQWFGPEGPKNWDSIYEIGWFVA